MFFGGFLCQSNYDWKKRYSRLAVGWNVWGFHELGLFQRVPRSNYDRKKGSVIWPSVGMFGVQWAWIVLAGSLIKLRPKKKVQSSGHWLQCRLVLAGLSLYFLASSLIKLQIMTGKKRYSHLAIGWNVYYVLLTYYTLVDRPSAMTLWGIHPGRKILALTWGLLVPPAKRGLRKDTMVDGWRPRRCWPSYSSINYTICNTRNKKITMFVLKTRK